MLHLSNPNVGRSHVLARLTHTAMSGESRIMVKKKSSMSKAATQDAMMFKDKPDVSPGNEVSSDNTNRIFANSILVLRRKSMLTEGEKCVLEYPNGCG